MSNQVILPEEALKDEIPRTLYGNKNRETIPVYDPTGSEHILASAHNSFIVLGRDRNASKASGTGGQGFTQCGKIDLVVGLNSSNNPNNKKTNPNFFNDAARIYLSQKSNVDKYFGLAQGSEVIGPANKSCVGIKADHVRIIGRNHIKLVTGQARIKQTEKDARGNELQNAGRIDLIAGNSTEPNFAAGGIGPIKIEALQPLVKGENLSYMVSDLVGIISDIQNQVFANKKAILKLSANYSSHLHIATAPGAPVTPSPTALAVIPIITECFTDLPTALVIEGNLASLEQNYLDEDFPLCIKSKSVRTT